MGVGMHLIWARPEKVQNQLLNFYKKTKGDFYGKTYSKTNQS